ncbi:MAG: hypothetical protein JWQ69_2290 [Pseudomonas sp.]|nr:hypothetical protein [Pseudomonas sp.]
MKASHSSDRDEPVVLGVVFAGLLACIYFSFILTASFAPDVLKIVAFGSVPFSFVYGFFVIVSGAVLTTTYVLYANRHPEERP